MPDSALTGGARYHIGTLEYTKRGLVVVFCWLLWGDFCFTLMETVEPAVLPFILKRLGASNLVLSFYITTIANAFNLTVCPVASFMSDRYRSRWGRRIPFLVFSTPFVGFFLVATGFWKEIGGFFFKHFAPSIAVSEAAFTIGLLALLVVGYQFFHMIVASVYCYLFNDVVPEQYLGRFMALFRAIGTLAGALFSFFVFPYAESHSKLIFVSFGVLYFVGFMTMCLRVKEGEYPPPPPVDKTKNVVVDSVRTFFKESYCHKFYWYFYLSFGAWAVSQAIKPFYVFSKLNTGLSMKEFAAITGVTGIASALLLIPSGWYVDKKHPIRVGLISTVWYLLLLPTNLIFLWNWDHGTLMVLTVIQSVLTLPVAVVLGATELPMFMRVLPRSRYGQFCSANSVVRSVMMIFAGVGCGLFVDGLKWFCQGIWHVPGDYYYRLAFFWQMVFVALALYYRSKLYKLWLKLGGDNHYVAPGFESDELALKAQHVEQAQPPEEAVSSVKRT